MATGHKFDRDPGRLACIMARALSSAIAAIDSTDCPQRFRNGPAHPEQVKRCGRILEYHLKTWPELAQAAIATVCHRHRNQTCPMSAFEAEQSPLATVDLPQPDSPTNPRVSPLSMLKLTSDTA